MNIYLDNAATTPLSNEVFTEMKPYIFQSFANPSSAHALGRDARVAVERSRKIIAENLNARPENIFFTSGGTESDNTAILSAIHHHKIDVAITSRLEHHAVLNTLKTAEKAGLIKLLYVDNDASGNISLPHLDRLLEENNPALISLMHGNNEIGNLNPIDEIADLAEHHGAIFHSDTVQTIGHIRYNTRLLGPDFLVGSAHKFHGPKGVGFLYAKDPANLRSLLNGGSQESGKRAGTENVSGVVGLASALSGAYANFDQHESHIVSLKQQLINGIKHLPGIIFNGHSKNIDKSLSTVLSIALPQVEDTADLLTSLDVLGIYASGGSACTSHGSSHVIQALTPRNGYDIIRFSFSRYNTEQEIDQVITVLNQYSENTLGQPNLRSA